MIHLMNKAAIILDLEKQNKKKQLIEGHYCVAKLASLNFISLSYK
jgi:hypothetical protein